ncbi:MAG: 30S ribosomal protein S20 [Candidatus Andersenbacteria bacterium]
MPQTSAAKKALRVSQRRRAINDRWRRKLRASLKELRHTITSGKKESAQGAFTTAQKTLDRSVRHHILTKRAAARKKSRLQAAINKLAA